MRRGQLGAAFVVSATFLSLVDAIGETATFLLFALMCVTAFIWIMAKVPETKGKSLEEIQDAWAEHDERAQRAQGSDAPGRSDLSGLDNTEKKREVRA